MSRPKLLTKKEQEAVNAMSPAEVVDWCCDGFPDAVMLVDDQCNEFYRPIVNGVGVGKDCPGYWDAKAQAAEQLSRWLRRKADGEAQAQQAAPTCRSCDNPATCVGAYEGSEIDEPSCDVCCGHGNDDGRCEPVKAQQAASNG